MPLDRAAVAAKLAPPNLEVIRIQAKEIHHPLLQPLDFNIDDGLSPDEAAILAVLANPKLRALRDQRGIATAQLLQAGILPNPQISYRVDVPTGGTTTPGLVNAFGLDLSWEISSLITRGAKVAAAKADARSVDLDIAWQEWQTAQAAKLQVYHLFFFDRQLEIARQERGRLEENLEVVRRAASLGLVTVVDLTAAEAALQKMQVSVLTMEQQREQERVALNQLLGFPAEKILALQAKINPPELQGLGSADQLVEGLDLRRLDLLALRHGYESQEERLRSAILAQFPKISLGFSRAGDTSNIITTGFGITIDLPLFDRNQGAIAIETATRTKLFDEYIARLFEARGEIARLLANIRSLQRHSDTAERLIPTLQKVADSYREALLQGNADVLTYYNARAELLAKRMELVDLKRQSADMYVALEIAAGRLLGTPQNKEANP